jgi:hypothetical protein
MNNPDDIIICGVDADGNKRRILTATDGSIGGGGGGGGGATAAEIKTAIETATNLNLLEEVLGNSPLGGDYPTIQESVANNTGQLITLTQDLGRSFSTPATDDTGTFSLIQLFKRLLSVKLPTSLGTKTAANSFPVTLASDSTLGVNTIQPVSSTSFSGEISVANTATSIRPSVPERKKIILTNAGASIVYVDFTNSVSTTVYAFILNPGDSWMDDGDNIYTGTYWGITASGTSTINVRTW